MKYKVGDKVKVRNLQDGYKSPDGCYFNDDMERLAGEIVTIINVRGNRYDIKESGYSWVDDFFEEVEFSKDLITDLSVVTLDNGEKLLYIKDKDEFIDLKYGQSNSLCDLSDIDDDGYVCVGNHIIKVEQPTYASMYSTNEVREMTVEEISKALGYEVKIVKEK